MCGTIGRKMNDVGSVTKKIYEVQNENEASRSQRYVYELEWKAY